MSTQIDRRHRKVRRQRPAMNSGIHLPVGQAVSKTGYEQIKGSRGRPGDLTCRESKTGPDIVDCEFRKVCQYLVDTHAASQIFQHFPHGDAHAAIAGLPAALARFDRDEIAMFHGKNLRIRGQVVNIRMQCVSAFVPPPKTSGPQKSFDCRGPKVSGSHDASFNHASATFNCFMKF